MLDTLRQRNFALLWLAGLISVAGDYALMTALPLHAYTLTGSAIAAGAVFAATMVPRILLGSIAGVYVDRWDRKQVMIAADLLRAVALLPLLAVTSASLLWLLYLVRFATGAIGLFFDPAESALLPRLVGEERLVTANALNALNNNLGRLFGPAAGGVLYASGGIGAVVLIDAISFALSAALILLIRADARPETSPATATDGSAWSRLRDQWRAGLEAIGLSSTIRTIFLSLGIGLLAEGTLEIGFPPLILDVFQGGAQGAGLIFSAQAVGGIIAGVVVARAADAVAPRVLFAAGMIGLGLADLGVANAANLATPGPAAVTVACLFMALAGPPVVAMNAAATSILQAETTDAFRGRVFGALGTLQGVSVLAGLGIGALTIERVGVVTLLSLGAALWIVVGVFTLIRFPQEAPAALAEDAGGLTV